MSIDAGSFKTTANGIDFIELQGSNQMTWADHGDVTAVRHFIIHWTDVQEFMQEKLGHSEEVAGEVYWVDAEKHPLFEDLVAVSGHVKGWGVADDQGPSDSASYEYAEVQIKYAIPKYDLSWENYQDETIDFSGEYVRVPREGYRWKNADGAGLPAGEPVEETPGVIVSSQDLIIVQHRVPALNRAAIRACIGKVNSATFRDEAVGTVVYLGASARRSLNVVGPSPYNLTHRCKVRTPGWNYAKRPGKTTDGGWAELDPAPYEEVDLTSLIPDPIAAGA